MSAMARSCSSICAVPPGTTGQASARAPALHHLAGGREVVGEAVVDDVAGPEAGGVEGAGEAPVVGPRPFRVVDRPGRGEDAGEARRRRGVQAAEGQPAAVQLDQLGLAQQRQAGQRGAGRDLVGLDAGQPLGEPGRVVDRVAHQARQGVEHRGLALGGCADLLPVVVGAAFLWAHAPTPLSGTARVLAHDRQAARPSPRPHDPATMLQCRMVRFLPTFARLCMIAPRSCGARYL